MMAVRTGWARWARPNAGRRRVSNRAVPRLLAILLAVLCFAIAASAGAEETCSLTPAARALRAAAFQPVHAIAARAVVEPYLVALDELGRGPQPGCYERMAEDVPALLDRHCRGEKGRTGGELCGLLLTVKRDMDKPTCKAPSRSTRSPEEVLRVYAWIARFYLDDWEGFGRLACEAEQPACRRMEEVLYNAAKASLAARRPAAAIATLRALLDPRHHLDDTRVAKLGLLVMGEAHERLGDFEKAAASLERYAARGEDPDRMAKALHRAIALRLGLGDLAQAREDERVFEQRHAKDHPDLAAEIMLLFVEHAL